jgi:hypothetical protein
VRGVPGLRGLGAWGLGGLGAWGLGEEDNPGSKRPATVPAGAGGGPPGYWSGRPASPGSGPEGAHRSGAILLRSGGEPLEVPNLGHGSRPGDTSAGTEAGRFAGRELTVWLTMKSNYQVGTTEVRR